MKRLVLIIMAALVLALGATSCSQPQPDTLSPKSPKGSVLEYTHVGDYLGDIIVGTDYWGYQIRARVQNLGATGTITVFASITPQNVAYKGQNLRSVEVYLPQGGEMWVSFHFDVKWPNEGIATRVWTVP